MFNLSVKHEVRIAKPQRKETENRLRAWQNETTELLTRIPGPVKYPIRWTSERQRKAFFATNGFGRGIPTRRTGKVAEWGVFVDYPEITAIQDFTTALFAFAARLNPFKHDAPPTAPTSGIILAMTNNTSYQRYVTGVNQQGFHADNGWIHAPTITTVQLRKAEGILQGI